MSTTRQSKSGAAAPAPGSVNDAVLHAPETGALNAWNAGEAQNPGDAQDAIDAQNAVDAKDVLDAPDSVHDGLQGDGDHVDRVRMVFCRLDGLNIEL